MTSYRKFLFSVCTLIFIACSSTSSSVDSVDNRSQSIDSDVVQVTVSGDGPTKDQAVQSALRNAIEQSYGTFLSSNTKFLNDELIQDEITSVARGNILGYDLVSVNESKEGITAFLTAQVSLTKLAQFAQSKGQSVSVNSNIVYMNAVKEDFYEKNEYQIVQDYLASYKNTALFDYELDVQNPVRCSKQLYDRWFYRDACVNESYRISSQRWVYPIQIKFVPNNNYKEFYFGLINLLESISINEETIDFRNKTGLHVGLLYILDEAKRSTRLFNPYFLRNSLTLSSIKDKDPDQLYKFMTLSMNELSYFPDFIKNNMFNGYNLYYTKQQNSYLLSPRKNLQDMNKGNRKVWYNTNWDKDDYEKSVGALKSFRESASGNIISAIIVEMSDLGSYNYELGIYYDNKTINLLNGGGNNSSGKSSILACFLQASCTLEFESYVYFEENLFKDVTGFEIKSKF